MSDLSPKVCCGHGKGRESSGLMKAKAEAEAADIELSMDVEAPTHYEEGCLSSLHVTSSA